MSLLVAILLLGFGAVVAFALLIWQLLAPRSMRASAPKRAASAPTTTTTGMIQRTFPSNDEVRGARVRPAERRPDDPFDSFLRANDERS